MNGKNNTIAKLEADNVKINDFNKKCMKYAKPVAYLKILKKRIGENPIHRTKSMKIKQKHLLHLNLPDMATNPNYLRINLNPNLHQTKLKPNVGISTMVFAVKVNNAPFPIQ